MFSKIINEIRWYLIEWYFSKILLLKPLLAVANKYLLKFSLLMNTFIFFSIKVVISSKDNNNNCFYVIINNKF